MTSGQRVIEVSTDYAGTIECVYTNSLGMTMVRVQFDTVGDIQSWSEWIPADLVKVI